MTNLFEKENEHLCSPEPTKRIVNDSPDNIDEMALKPVSMNSCNLNQAETKKTIGKAKATEYHELRLNLQPVSTSEKSKPIKKKVDEKDMACNECRQFYYELNDGQTKVEDDWFNEVVEGGKDSKDNLLPQVTGCHDANFTAAEVFLKMLRDERTQLQKTASVAYHNNTKQLSGKLDFVLPNEELCKLRNNTVDEVIFGIGQRLKQNALTQNLAVKLFDIAFIHQQEFKGSLDEAISRYVRQSLVAGNELPKDKKDDKEENNKESLAGDVRNEPKNLKMLAAQCLLLASKVIAVSRLYPAEIVYQVRGWSRDEFEILRSGSIEEYLLGLLDFDLIMLTPADFLQFVMKSWQQATPCRRCQRVPSEVADLLANPADRQKLELLANQFCQLLVSQMGPQISLLYLPSQVATVALKLGLTTLITSFSDDVKQMTIDECVKIQGYTNQAKTCDRKAKADWFDLADEVDADEHSLGIVRLQQEAEKNNLISALLLKNEKPWEMNEIKLVIGKQQGSKSSVLSLSPVKKERATIQCTPNKKKSGGVNALSPVKQMHSSGASPMKRPGRQTLPGISQENVQKFERSLYEKSLLQCTKVYGDKFLEQMSKAMEEAEHPSQMSLPIDLSDIYPRFMYSQLEQNNLITHRFFAGAYKNTRNAELMRESLLRQRKQRGLKVQDEDADQINLKRMPQLVEIDDADLFYANNLLEVGLQNQEQVIKRNQKVRASLVESLKKTRQVGSSPLKLDRDRLRSFENDKENQEIMSRPFQRHTGHVGLQPLFTKIQPGLYGREGFEQSCLRTPVQCELDPSSASSSRDDSQLSISLLDYAEATARNSMLLKDTYMGHQTDSSAPSGQMQALRGGGNQELRRQLDILDQLPYQPCPPTHHGDEEGIESYVPLRNSLASNMHPMDVRSSDLRRFAMPEEHALFPPSAGFGIRTFYEPPRNEQEPLFKTGGLDQHRLLNLNPIEIPCGSMDLVSSSTSSLIGNTEMKIQNQLEQAPVDHTQA